MLKAIFELARMNQPAVIFIDEIDSMLSKRAENEQNYLRRIKTEFLVMFDGVHSEKSQSKWVFVMGATNRPQDLDTAVLRRFERRILVDIPGQNDRKALIKQGLKDIKHDITPKQLISISKQLDGYSGSDIAAIIKSAAFAPLKEISKQSNWMTMDKNEIPHVSKNHFMQEIKNYSSSCDPKEIKFLRKWGQ